MYQRDSTGSFGASLPVINCGPGRREQQGKDQVFGLVQFANNSGIGLAAIMVTPIADKTLFILGGAIKGWRLAFLAVGVLSLALSVIICFWMSEPERDGCKVNEDLDALRGESTDELKSIGESNDSMEIEAEEPTERHGAREPGSFLAELRFEMKLLMSYFRIRSFVVILTQGMFGCIPWSSMTFLVLWMQYFGLLDIHAGVVAMTLTFCCALGGIVGGMFGDYLAKKSRFHGRPITAQMSVFSGIVMFVILLTVVPKDPDSFPMLLGLAAAFGLTASWAGVGCNSPLLLELVAPSSRARIIALLNAFNGAAAAVLGGPVVGLLAEGMGYQAPEKGESIAHLSLEQRNQNLDSLTHAILLGTIPPWLICFTAFTALHWTYERDVKGSAQNYSEDYEMTLVGSNST